MSGELSDLTMKVVGVVKNEMKEPGMQPNLQDIVSENLCRHPVSNP